MVDGVRGISPIDRGARMIISNTRCSTVTWVLLAIVSAGPAIAVDLDAPIQTAPTVASEIRRGWNATEACGIPLDALTFARCVNLAVDNSRQKIVQDEPFELGAFFAAWFKDDRMLHAAATQHMTIADLDASARLDFWSYRTLQKKLGLTNDQLMSLSPLKPALLIERINYWASLGADRAPPPMP